MSIPYTIYRIQKRIVKTLSRIVDFSIVESEVTGSVFEDDENHPEGMAVSRKSISFHGNGGSIRSDFSLLESFLLLWHDSETLTFNWRRTKWTAAILFTVAVMDLVVRGKLQLTSKSHENCTHFMGRFWITIVDSSPTDTFLDRILCYIKDYGDARGCQHISLRRMTRSVAGYVLNYFGGVPTSTLCGFDGATAALEEKGVLEAHVQPPILGVFNVVSTRYSVVVTAAYESVRRRLRAAIMNQALMPSTFDRILIATAVISDEFFFDRKFLREVISDAELAESKERLEYIMFHSSSGQSMDPSIIAMMMEDDDDGDDDKGDENDGVGNEGARCRPSLDDDDADDLLGGE